MARPLIPMTGGIPMPTASDAGKVLTVGETGKYGLAAVPSELPTPTISDAGKAIVVNNNGAYALDNVGGASPLICTDTDGTLDKTMGEIQTAVLSGRPVYLTVSPDRLGVYGFAISLVSVQATKEGTWEGSVSFIDENVIGYNIGHRSTEAEALAAYPSYL